MAGTQSPTPSGARQTCVRGQAQTSHGPASQAGEQLVCTGTQDGCELLEVLVAVEVPLVDVLLAGVLLVVDVARVVLRVLRLAVVLAAPPPVDDPVDHPASPRGAASAAIR
jgi:hypothetical protein